MTAAPLAGIGSTSDEGVAESLYRTVRLIRRFEERAIELVKSGDIVGGIHPYIGQEAIAAGVCGALQPDDVITSTHRGHGHVLAKGADPARMLAELAGRTTGLNRGRGGSMHAADFSLGILGANAMVGANGAITVGAVWALRHQRSSDSGEHRVGVSFFGDGAVNQGVLLEAMNLAALWRVPVLFVCENNGYATSMRTAAASAGTLTGRAEAFGIRTAVVDGMDVQAVHTAAGEALRAARTGGGPAFLECRTYRFDAHHTFEHKTRPRYRDQAEIDAARTRDPVEIAAGRISAAARDHVDAEIEALLDDAVRFALAGPRPDPADALAHLYSTGLRARPGASNH